MEFIIIVVIIIIIHLFFLVLPNSPSDQFITWNSIPSLAYSYGIIFCVLHLFVGNFGNVWYI